MGKPEGKAILTAFIKLLFWEVCNFQIIYYFAFSKFYFIVLK